MLRLSRPLTVALLWLAIALLPIRGWAATTMPLFADPAHVSQVAPAASIDHDAIASPCHDGHGSDDEAGVGGGHTCALCDACHFAVAGLVDAPLAPPLLPAARPRLEPAQAIERPVLSGPERPPRHFLA
jgi:hypothetical protein